MTTAQLPATLPYSTVLYCTLLYSTLPTPLHSTPYDKCGLRAWVPRLTSERCREARADQQDLNGHPKAWLVERWCRDTKESSSEASESPAPATPGLGTCLTTHAAYYFSAVQGSSVSTGGVVEGHATAGLRLTKPHVFIPRFPTTTTASTTTITAGTGMEGHISTTNNSDQHAACCNYRIARPKKPAYRNWGRTAHARALNRPSTHHIHHIHHHHHHHHHNHYYLSTHDDALPYIQTHASLLHQPTRPSLSP